MSLTPREHDKYTARDRSPSECFSKNPLKELCVKRSSIKGQITKFKNYLDRLPSEQLTNIQLAELSIKLGKIEVLSTKFDELQSQIEVLNSQNIDVELDERENVEQDIIFSIASAKTLIETQSSSQTQQGRESLSLNSQGHHDSTDFIRLPQINIAKFNGAYFRWLEFRDTYTSLVHINDRLSPIHKFHLLVSYLEGDAARIISNLEVSSSNYIEAWQLLCNRYDNKRLLINHHLHSLFNIQNVQRESDHSLRFIVDHVSKNLRALSSLGQCTDNWDVIIIYMISAKLDSGTLAKWEECRSNINDIPTLGQFNKFLIDRADVLETIHRNKFNSFSNKPQTSQVQIHNNNKSYSNVNRNHFSQTKSFSANIQKPLLYPCVVCNSNHKIFECNIFKSKALPDRWSEVKKHNLCSNCLRKGHDLKNCYLRPCMLCNEKHNTLLHNNSKSNYITNTSSTSQSISNYSSNIHSHVILSTAIINLFNPKTKQSIQARALLDSGSQTTFITRSVLEKLSLIPVGTDVINVVGIGNRSSPQVINSCVISIASLLSSFQVTLPCLVLDKLTDEIPKVPFDVLQLDIPSHIQLADPHLNQPSAIDIIIGADIFWDLLCKERISLGHKQPVLQYSKLGWLLCGPISFKYNHKNINCSYVSTNHNNLNQVDQMLTRFWELDYIPHKCLETESDKECEKHFIQNTYRLESGRFCVSLPFCESPEKLGDSYQSAKKRFLQLEKRFRYNPSLKSSYINFINEYMDLNHLSKAESIDTYGPCYFLSHHAVFKENSESTKLRVVFDGSSPTTSGYSLNDILRVGPSIQNSLFSILIRSRLYKYLLTADIEKMYRQVFLNERHRNLQLILWRSDESLPIDTLKLNTVTYGTASASYLSTRCLWQLGEECNENLIRTIIQNDFLVDDLITGSNDESELKYIQSSISNQLKKGGFNLRKFKTNSVSIFNHSNVQNDNLMFSDSTNTLGLGWNPKTDTLTFPIKDIHSEATPTKRIITSNSFKIFDPLGLLSPVIIVPKMLIQSLWVSKVDWDEPTSPEVKMKWLEFSVQFNNLSKLKIPRLVLCDLPKTVELHAFSDASQKAYGACIYLRSVDSNNRASIHLLCSKSKVSPIKPQTIPRLELCAALLSARLYQFVIGSVRIKIDNVFFWTDSSVVLSWLRTEPRKLKTFVANRVVEISELTHNLCWRYVPTADNPADLISRGVQPNLLPNLHIWWHGPQYLQSDVDTWPIQKGGSSKSLIDVEVKSHSAIIQEPIINFIKYSSLNKLQRIMAYVKRFIHNCRLSNKFKLNGPLTVQEIQDSFLTLCYLAQQQSFHNEFTLIKNNKTLPCKSKILSLSPFIDENNIIRVGGRISCADYSYQKKHPILLDYRHNLAKQIFEYEHRKNLHSGPQLLLSLTREKVWVINGRRLARQTVHKCILCRRLSAVTLQPKMGDLPSQRITPDFPFLSVGLDYAGPFFILNRKGRGAKLVKCYMCLFVCLRYKCVHIEAVSSLSKEDYLKTLRRFIARRGKPSEIFSDNGRNFVAAANELKVFFKQNNKSICDYATQEGIKFKFIPAYAPHFGGIWEAGVKSAKFHVKRVMGNSHLTFDEILTLFTQVEAILNSRPLYPLSNSPNDFLPLTPGHFLIGRPLTTLPSPTVSDKNLGPLQRFERLQQIHQHFWQRWQLEYVHELQNRLKWKTNKDTLNIGDLVLMEEPHTPPLSWHLGRVRKLFTGPDGVARVADVETCRGTVRKPLTRLCVLLQPDEEKKEEPRC